MLIKFDSSSKTGILVVKFTFATANLKIETLRMRRRLRVFVVGVMQVRMRIRYAVSKKAHCAFRLYFKTSEVHSRKESKIHMGTIHHPRLGSLRKKRITHIISRVCGADLRYICHRYACALDPLKEQMLPFSRCNDGLYFVALLFSQYACACNKTRRRLGGMFG